MHIFPKEYFCPIDFWMNKKITENTYAIHYFEASWLDKETKKRIRYERNSLFKILNRLISTISSYIKRS